MGTPHTYDVCDMCGEATVNLNNAGTWTHVEPTPAGIPATDCKSPFVRVKVSSKAGQTTASHGRARRLTSGRRDQQ